MYSPEELLRQVYMDPKSTQREQQLAQALAQALDMLRLRGMQPATDGGAPLFE